jgi:hypothetical protein
MRNFPILILLLANTAFGEPPSWVAKSNQNAQVLLEIDARFNPESAGASGINGLDEQITDLKPDSLERQAKPRGRRRRPL